MAKKKRVKQQQQHRFELAVEAERNAHPKKKAKGSSSVDATTVCESLRQPAQGPAGIADTDMEEKSPLRRKKKKNKRNVHSRMQLRRNDVVRGIRIKKSEDKERIRQLLRQEEDAHSSGDQPML